MPFSMPPGLRIPYDSDGTIGLVHPSVVFGGGVLDVHPTALQAMNSTRGAGLLVPSTVWQLNDSRPVDSIDIDAANYPYLCLVFPVPIRLRGFFFSRASGFPNNSYDQPLTEPRSFATNRVRLESSPNSTNSVDGDWNNLGTFVRGDVPLAANGTPGINATTGATVLSSAPTSDDPARDVQSVYRELYEEDAVGIHSLAGSATRQVRSIRIYPLTPSTDGQPAYPYGWYILHLYGEPDTEAVGLNYLQGWRADSDMRLGGATMSWGDVPLGSSADKAFRIKNQSTSDTAFNVLVSAEDERYYGAPSPAQQISFSLDGIVWTPTLTIGGIGPEAVSPTIYMRRVTPSNALLASWSPKVKFDVGSWA